MAQSRKDILKGEEAVQLNAWLPRELHEWLSEEALIESRGNGRVTMSEITRRALEAERVRVENGAVVELGLGEVRVVLDAISALAALRPKRHGKTALTRLARRLSRAIA